MAYRTQGKSLLNRLQIIGVSAISVAIFALMLIKLIKMGSIPSILKERSLGYVLDILRSEQQ